MIKSQDQDEFIAVRVQDPRVQNEGSWNSYVDFKIFLHTNSKAFTAKTSCVRRRYSEFVWLRKKLQKNAGLVPVPELPSKSFFFSFNNEDFIEKRRKGLQYFLDKVVHMTVCLSDSQLHLFLQTQLPVSHIQDCVQGLTPYTVTDAILTYASSNLGWAQGQDSDTQEQCPTPVPYESMESPSPHMPSSQCGPPHSLTASGAAASAADSVIVDVHDVNLVELQSETESKTLGLMGDCHMKAIVEVHTEEADLTIVDQEDGVIEGRASEGTQQSRGGYENVALEAVDLVETLLIEVGLGEQTVTDQHQEAFNEETSEGQGSFLVEQNEVEAVTVEVSDEDPLNVEPFEQKKSLLNSATDNDGFLSELSVIPHSLANHECVQDKHETNIAKNGPVEEHHGDQNQSKEGKIETTPVVEGGSAQADVDEGVFVEKTEQEDTTYEDVQCAHLQSLNHCEEESNQTHCVQSNGHTSDSSVMSAIEDSTEEAPDCEFGKMVSTTVIESVVSDVKEDHTVKLEVSFEDCEPKDQICYDQTGQPYTDLSAQGEGAELYPHGNANQEQADGHAMS